MYLKRLEIQGFKTFPQKTALEFVPDREGRGGITAVVGPNGSGKSNIADAIRWVMGEQSMKLLRGKKSEDVIFSGTSQRARSGFAEVTLVLDASNDPESELTEVAVTRRLYRDGQSDYEVNKKAARLQDVALLLAQSGIAQRSYSVIGQGMVDQVLIASPTERKEFFDEAFGLRPFQLKRNAAVNKLDDARKNLLQTEAIIREIEPRLSSLERQVKRLKDKERFEQELSTLERAYYGHAWREIIDGLASVQSRLSVARAEEQSREQEAAQLEKELEAMEKATPISAGFRELRLSLDQLTSERASLREQQMQLETRRAVAAVRAEKSWAPLPLSKIIDVIDRMHDGHDALHQLLIQDEPNVSSARAQIMSLRQTSADLLGKLQRPAPELEVAPERDPVLEREIVQIVTSLQRLSEQTKEIEHKMDSWNSNEENKRKHVFEVQRKLTQKRQEAQAAERRASESAIEVARLETRRDGVLADVRQHAMSLEGELDMLARQTVEINADSVSRIQRLRSQLEWIGGIDVAIMKEYEETRDRYEFLIKHTNDLRDSIQGLEIVIVELDATIRVRSEAAFRKLDQEFSVFFKRIFDGGEAKLVEIEPEQEVDEQGNTVEALAEEKGISGIDIQVTPPGKRFKSISLLSGGERALTSIALICAIMATNPSPFVVLDEVDAALDEANSRKFAQIIASLSDRTQFVIVTHNRATMQEANILYGVTMGNDGVSQLLSVKLEDVEKMKKK